MDNDTLKSIDNIRGQLLALTSALRTVIAASPDAEALRNDLAQHATAQRDAGLFRDTPEATLLGFELVMRLLRIETDKPAL